MNLTSINLLSICVTLLTLWPMRAVRCDEAAVQRILERESQQDVDRRASLKSERVSSTSPEAWWQSGFLKINGKWVSYESTVARSDEASGRLAYEAERMRVPTSAVGHMQLAKWCRKNQLLDREVAHLHAALALSPQLANQQTMKRAGYQLVMGMWLSEEERQRLETKVSQIKTSLKQWDSKLTRINQWMTGTRRHRDLATEQLTTITDPDAVAAIDLVLGRSPNAAVVSAAMNALSNIHSFESSQVLAKYAVFSENPTIRREAADHLKNRHFSHFVPQLIKLLATEARALGARTSFSRNRMLGTDFAIQLVLLRETDKQIQFGYAYSTFPLLGVYLGETTTGRLEGARLGLLPGNQYALSFDGQRELALATDLSLHDKLRRLDSANQMTATLNKRVAEVLATVTNRPQSVNPRLWWRWWELECDVNSTKAVTHQVVEVIENEAVIPVPFMKVRVMESSCFQAGTPVWTEAGPRPIESIKIGDRVLSKNVNTGELAYRTVKYTSIRKSNPMVTLRIHGEAITATGGHLFWQSGYGWTQARRLGTKNRLHGVTGSVSVKSVEPGPTAKTYNLVVSDFHTYFVGESGLLVQDLLLPEPNNMLAPGLSRFEL